MLELFGSGLMSMWLDMAGVKVKPVDALEMFASQSSPGLVLATDPNPSGASTVQLYLRGLQALKLVTADQGIWMQSGPVLIANHQGTVPLPAASLTKIATTIASLQTWKPDHQFETLISATGPVRNGVLQGDLIVQGSGDPFFVWEEAITLGNTLNKLGIRQVAGNLVIVGNFAMNYEPDPARAGVFLKQGMNQALWPRYTATLHSMMRRGTAKPQVLIAGKVLATPIPPANTKLLVRHHSLPLKQILKEMNIYSNNEMATMLGQLVGGAEAVRSLAATAARVPISEIQLINTSGLGVENRISPRAACAMLMALQQQIQPYDLTIADLFPVSGRDKRGTMIARQLPKATVMKTGTLNTVSALAGVMPTRDRGLVWFAIINRGTDISGLRRGQDQLLQNLIKQLQVAPTVPAALTYHANGDPSQQLGEAKRNEIIR